MAENSTSGFNFGDLLGGGKGLEVLADLIRSSFGRVTNSYLIRKDAAAKAEELLCLHKYELKRTTMNNDIIVM
jgi:hypothetical protein